VLIPKPGTRKLQPALEVVGAPLTREETEKVGAVFSFALSTVRTEWAEDFQLAADEGRVLGGSPPSLPAETLGEFCARVVAWSAGG
jgi:hypothetical protein